MGNPPCILTSQILTRATT